MTSRSKVLVVVLLAALAAAGAGWKWTHVQKRGPALERGASARTVGG